MLGAEFRGEAPQTRCVAVESDDSKHRIEEGKGRAPVRDFEIRAGEQLGVARGA
jgi:hypothetical protein